MSFLIKIKYYIGIFLGVVALIGYAFLSGRKSGKQEVQAEVKEQEIVNTKAVAKAEVVAAVKAKETVQKVSNSSDSSVDSELQRFTRD
ncbi:MAG: hypothetical protein [Caudoviricetes sp.]|nr:MAG: hypothetical protein [Caudoviricetes sp.]